MCSPTMVRRAMDCRAAMLAGWVAAVRESSATRQAKGEKQFARWPEQRRARAGQGLAISKQSARRRCCLLAPGEGGKATSERDADHVERVLRMPTSQPPWILPGIVSTAARMHTCDWPDLDAFPASCTRPPGPLQPTNMGKSDRGFGNRCPCIHSIDSLFCDPTF
jgi:hypothetical protein